MSHVPEFAAIAAVSVTDPGGRLIPNLFALDFSGRIWTREGTHPWRLVPSQTSEETST